MKSLGHHRNQWILENGSIDLRRGKSGRDFSLLTQPAPIKLNIEQTALIIIDMQNDFCHKKGWLSSIGVDTEPLSNISTTINNITSISRIVGIPIVWLNWGNRVDLLNISPSLLHVYDNHFVGAGLGSEINEFSRHVLVKNSWGAKLYDNLVVSTNDIFVDKYRMSGFWDNELDSILRNMDIKSLFFLGVNVDQCVLSTLIDASCLGYDCILIEDGCATTSPHYCSLATIYNVKQCFGFTVQSQNFSSIIKDN